MTRGVRWTLFSSAVLVALLALAGCSHYMMAEREPWRRDGELACLNSGAVKESPARVRISSIDGPGACGIYYPLRVSALGDNGPLGYSDEAPVPPGAIPNGSMPQRWPVTQPSAAPSAPVRSQQLPPLQAGAPQSYPSQPYPQQSYPPRSYPPPSATPVGQPLSLNPPGLAPPEDDEDLGVPGGPPHRYYGGATAPYTPAPPSAAQPVPPVPPLGPPRAPLVTGSAGPVELKP